MPPSATPARPAGSISRLRGFLLLELPGWAILAVSVGYTLLASGGWGVVFFQVVLLSAALAWFVGGRLASLTAASLLFGWAAGTLAYFTLLSIGSIGLYLLPVSAFVVVVLVLLLGARNRRSWAAAGGGVVLAIAVLTVFVGLFAGR
jgi:hypothetical protein